MNFFDKFYVWLFGEYFRAANWLIGHIFSMHWGWFFGGSMLALISFFAGKRLEKFNHPDHPFLSPLVRVFGGRTLHWTGLLGLTAVVVLALAVVCLVSVGALAHSSLKELDHWSAIKYYFSLIWPWISSAVWGTVVGMVGGLWLSVFLVMRTIPLLERGQGLRDVRMMQKLFAKMKTYDPLKRLNFKKGVFIGLEDGKHPVYVPLKQFSETHTQVIGASGSGKGIALGLLGFQFSVLGESVIVFDPKGDDRLPKVLALAAKGRSIAFHHINLNPDTPPQFNLISGTTESEIEELLVGGLGLQPSSGGVDYYRGIDQDAAASVAAKAIQVANSTLVDLLNIALINPEISKAENFVRRLRQVCQLPAIQTNHDIDLTGIVERGEVLYIRGSTDNHRVKTLQTMLLIRVLQIIKARGGSKKVALILDEFKHLLCSVSLDALGTVRELGCHALLAHQSLGDLGGVPGLRREDVEPRVVDNTTLKLVYRLNDAKASADFAMRSGKQRTHAEGVRSLDGEGKDQRSWTETQQFRMSEDLFTHLHRPSDGNEVVAAGVLFGYKEARLIAVSPINVKGAPPPVNSAPIETRVSMTQVGELI